ncbi:hypothetical protein MMC17_006765 [Xylographa soralifera]|nr:hypothetical protein [Xylographa soralifera]
MAGIMIPEENKSWVKAERTVTIVTSEQGIGDSETARQREMIPTPLHILGRDVGTYNNPIDLDGERPFLNTPCAAQWHIAHISGRYGKKSI